MRATLNLAASDELGVMIHPVTAFRTLAASPNAPGTPALVRRLFAYSCLVGAFVSFAATGRLVAPFVLDGLLWWSFLPLLQTILIALTLLVFARGRMPLGRAIELFFIGQGPWLFWLLGISTFLVFAPGAMADTLLSITSPFLLGSAVASLIWANATTFGFLRGGMGLSIRRAAIATLIYSVAFWGVLLAYLFAVEMLQEVIR